MFYSTKPGLSAYVDSPEMVSSLSGLINSIERSRAWKTSPGLSPRILMALMIRGDRRRNKYARRSPAILPTYIPSWKRWRSHLMCQETQL